MADFSYTQKYFRSLKIIFYAMLIFQVIVPTVLLLMVYISGRNGGRGDLAYILMPVAAVITLAGVFAGNMLMRQKQKQPWSNQLLIEKLRSYRTLLFVKFLLFVVPSLFAAIAFYVTGHLTFLFLSLLIVLIFISHYPTKNKLVYDLRLNNEEQKAIYRAGYM